MNNGTHLQADKKKENKFELVGTEQNATELPRTTLNRYLLVAIVALLSIPVLGVLTVSIAGANPALMRAIGALCGASWFPVFAGLASMVAYGVPPMVYFALKNTVNPNPTHLIVTRRGILALKLQTIDHSFVFQTMNNRYHDAQLKNLDRLAEDVPFYSHPAMSGIPIVGDVAWSTIVRVSVSIERSGARIIYFHQGGNKKVKMRLGDVLGNQSRAALLEGLKTYAPEAIIDPDAYELLAPMPETSYTELWITALSAPPSLERMAPLVCGASIGAGKYEIVGRLGAGGQAQVYEAIAPGDNKPSKKVVLKEYILPIGVTRAATKSAIESLEREAKLLTKLEHPQIVKVLDFFIEDHRGFLVFELVTGKNLRTIVQERGSMNETTARKIGVELCEVLAYLHAQEPPVVHQDVSPDNIILQDNEEVKLVDFAIAQQANNIAQNIPIPSASGKRAYMPPEQFRGKATTQSDLYALGCTLHFLVTGEESEPLTTSHPQKIQQNSTVSDDFDRIVATCTQLDLSTRYNCANDLQLDLQRM